MFDKKNIISKDEMTKLRKWRCHITDRIRELKWLEYNLKPGEGIKLDSTGYADAKSCRGSYHQSAKTYGCNTLKFLIVDNEAYCYKKEI